MVIGTGGLICANVDACAAYLEELSSTAEAGTPGIEAAGSGGLDTQLAIEEAAANSNAAKVIIEAEDINDSAWQGWEKLQWVHRAADGTKTVVHFMRNVTTGETAGFKIKEVVISTATG